MNPPIYHGRSSLRLWLGLAALSCLFARTPIIKAQVPVITNPGDLHYLDVNTALDPLDPNPIWTTQAPMPTARAGFAIAATTDKIYVIGGAILDNCTTVPTVEAYDPNSGTWTLGTDLASLPPPARWRPSGGTLGGLIYVVGGLSTESGCNTDPVALDTVQAYDPTANTWSDKPPLPMARLQVGVGVDSVSNLLYAVGGSTVPPTFTALDTVEVFDPTANGGIGAWTTLNHLNTPRGLPAVAAVNGKIYAIGGQKENNGVVNTVEEYDPGTLMWTTKSNLIQFPRLNSAAAVLNDKVYVVGGEFGGSPLSTVEVYDPAQDSWTTGVSMPTARRVLGAAAAVVNNNIYAVGGEAPAATTGQEFTYQITATNNPTSYSTTTLPDGLTLDPARGIISGIPTTPANAFVVTFTATNDSGQSDPKDVSFYIKRGPPDSSEVLNIVSSSCATARAGQPFAFQVLTNNASSPQLAATGLPYDQGVTIDPGTGLISGTVTDNGTAQSFGVSVGLTEADGSATAQSFLELTFVSDPAVPIISSSSNGTLILNQFFSYTITSDPPNSFLDYMGLDGILDGSLPAGLSFDKPTGTISGIYTGETSGAPRRKSATTGHRADSRLVEGSSGAIDTIKKEPPPLIQLFAGDGSTGTGTAPLNFTIGLHDFEVEALSEVTSEGTGYVIFTDDPNTSGGAAGRLEATQTGDFVTYTVPIAMAGTYDVIVGIQTNNGNGVFQLAINGMDQGSPQDEYSPTLGYDVRNLGRVNFATPGEQTFQFRVTGPGEGNGFFLVFDYLDLVPYFEAEGLGVQANSAPLVTIHDRNLSGGTGILLGAIQVGDYVTFTVPAVVPGIYDVRVGVKTNTDKAIFQLAIDNGTGFINQGYAQDEYNPTITYELRDLGTVNLTAGNKAFKFSVTGKNSQSTGYTLLFDYIELILTTRLEAEKLPEQANAPYKRIFDPMFSGGKGALLNARATGKFVTYTVAIPLPGTYDLKVGIKTGPKNGIFQLAIGGVNQGLPQDEYSATSGYAVRDLGSVSFTSAGNQSFQFLVTSRNPNSIGYQLDFDYVDLARSETSGFIVNQ